VSTRNGGLREAEVTDEKTVYPTLGRCETVLEGERSLSVHVEFVLEFVEPTGLAEFLDALAEVVLTEAHLDVVLLDCDGGLPVAVVALHAPPYEVGGCNPCGSR
jgi:hypothetical protein